MGSGLRPIAPATPRTMSGRPTARATSPYEAVSPYGMSSRALQTARSKGLALRSRVRSSNERRSPAKYASSAVAAGSSAIGSRRSQRRGPPRPGNEIAARPCALASSVKGPSGSRRRPRRGRRGRSSWSCRIDARRAATELAGVSLRRRSPCPPMRRPPEWPTDHARDRSAVQQLEQRVGVLAHERLADVLIQKLRPACGRRRTISRSVASVATV